MLGQQQDADEFFSGVVDKIIDEELSFQSETNFKHNLNINPQSTFIGCKIELGLFNPSIVSCCFRKNFRWEKLMTDVIDVHKVNIQFMQLLHDVKDNFFVPQQW